MEKNARHARWSTALKNGVVRFLERSSMSSIGRLGSFVLRPAPSGHRRLLQIELVDWAVAGCK